MTLNEAFVTYAMEGYNITHTSFLPEEYIRLTDNDTIVTNDGYTTTVKRFLADRTGKEWETGWSLHEFKKD